MTDDCNILGNVAVKFSAGLQGTDRNKVIVAKNSGQFIKALEQLDGALVTAIDCRLTMDDPFRVNLQTSLFHGRLVAFFSALSAKRRRWTSQVANFGVTALNQMAGGQFTADFVIQINALIIFPAFNS